MDIDRLTHASIYLDAALEQAHLGRPEDAREFIRKCLDSLEAI